VSAIVTVLNGRDEIRDCIVSLLRTEYPEDRREILVVDNGSTDGTPAVLRNYPVRQLREERRGVCYARNCGLASARGEIVAFTDPDCVVSGQWLRELVRPFADDGVGGVGGAILPYPGAAPAERYAARRRSHAQERPLSHPKRPFAMTPNVAFRRALLRQVGGFDQRFPGGGWEDADLCWRLARQAGCRLVYTPRAVVFHRYRSTPKAFFIQHMRYGYGLALLRRKYRDELPWRWPDRVRAYRDLAASAVQLGRVLLATPRTQSGSQERETAYFTFLRQLGQRVGFLRGRAAGWAWR
jgi:GT2 family glycosyltransferase